MKDVNRLVNKIVYICIIIGVLISFYEYIYGFIRFELFFRSILIYIILLVLFLIFSRFKITDRIWIKILIVSLSILSSFFYSRFLYKIDLFVLVVPENYIGNVEIEINSSTSPTKVKPIDGAVFLEIKENGKFSTSSNFNMIFNRIQVLEKVNGSIVVNKQLYFVNDKVSKKRDSLNNIYTIIQGNIVRK